MTVPRDRYAGVEKPWRSVEILHRLYWHGQMTQEEISRYLGCGHGTIGEWMRRLDVPRRTMMESHINNTPNYVPLVYDIHGYPRWHTPETEIHVHRLLAVAEFGLEAVIGKHVHHGSKGDGPNELPPAEAPWANWPGNLRLVSNGEHQSLHHTKCEEPVRREIADLYESTDKSSYDLADEFDVSNTTILHYHEEFYDDGGQAA
jgi:hypothetical protein